MCLQDELLFAAVQGVFGSIQTRILDIRDTAAEKGGMVIGRKMDGLPPFASVAWLELELAHKLEDAGLVSALRDTEPKGADGVQVG